MIWEKLGKHQEAARAAGGMIITRERVNMMDLVLLYFIKWTASDSLRIVMFYDVFYDVFMMLFTCGFQMPQVMPTIS